MYDDVRAQLEEANSGEPRNTEQRGLGSYQQADSRLAKNRTSSVDIGGQENPIEPHDVPHDVTLFRKSDEGGDTSDSDDDDHLSVADAASMACASGEDSPAMAKDDQDAGSSRAVDAVYFGVIVKIWILHSFQIDL